MLESDVSPSGWKTTRLRSSASTRIAAARAGAALRIAARAHAEAQIGGRVAEHALAMEHAQHAVGDLGLAPVRDRGHASRAGVARHDDLVRAKELDVHVLAEAHHAGRGAIRGA